MSKSRKNPRWMYRCPYDGKLYGTAFCPDHPRASLERAYVDDPETKQRRLTAVEVKVVERALRGAPPLLQERMPVIVEAILPVIENKSNTKFFQQNRVEKTSIPICRDHMNKSICLALHLAALWIGRSEYGSGLSAKDLKRMSARRIEGDFKTWLQKYKFKVGAVRRKKGSRALEARHVEAERHRLLTEKAEILIRGLVRGLGIPPEVRDEFNRRVLDGLLFDWVPGPNGDSVPVKSDFLEHAVNEDGVWTFTPEAERRIQQQTKHVLETTVPYRDGKGKLREGPWWRVEMLQKNEASLGKRVAGGKSPWSRTVTSSDERALDTLIEEAKTDTELARALETLRIEEREYIERYGLRRVDVSSRLGRARALVQDRLRAIEARGDYEHISDSSRGAGPAVWAPKGYDE